MIHLLVWTVATMHPHNRGLVSVAVCMGRRAAERLRPIGGEPLAVLRMRAVAERVVTTSSAITLACQGLARRTKPLAPPAAS